MAMCHRKKRFWSSCCRVERRALPLLPWVVTPVQNQHGPSKDGQAPNRRGEVVRHGKADEVQDGSPEEGEAAVTDTVMSTAKNNGVRIKGRMPLCSVNLGLPVVTKKKPHPEAAVTKRHHKRWGGLSGQVAGCNGWVTDGCSFEKHLREWYNPRLLNHFSNVNVLSYNSHSSLKSS